MKYNELSLVEAAIVQRDLMPPISLFYSPSMNEVSLNTDGSSPEELPDPANSQSQAGAADARPGESGGKVAKGTLNGCILVVDDRRDIRFLAQHFIQKAGGTVVTADDGQRALEILQQDATAQQIDLVLMDMQMPVMDGYEAVKRLRSGGFDKPIIALTANAMREDRDRCLAVGCNDYASKPLDGVKLVQLISGFLS